MQPDCSCLCAEGFSGDRCATGSASNNIVLDSDSVSVEELAEIHANQLLSIEDPDVLEAAAAIATAADTGAFVVGEGTTDSSVLGGPPTALDLSGLGEIAAAAPAPAAGDDDDDDDAMTCSYGTSGVPDTVACDTTGTLFGDDDYVVERGSDGLCQCVCKSGYSGAKCDDDSMFASYLIYCGGDSALATTYADLMADPTSANPDHLQAATKDCTEARTTYEVRASDSDAFTTTGFPTWPDQITLAAGTDGRNEQTLRIFITRLPAGGAKYRVRKSRVNGNMLNGAAVDLTLGENEIKVSGAGFDRTVIVQFMNGVEFNQLSVNNVLLHGAAGDDDDAAAADAALCDEVSVACCKERLVSVMAEIQSDPDADECRLNVPGETPILFKDAVINSFRNDIRQQHYGCYEDLNSVEQEMSTNPCVEEIGTAVAAGETRLPQCQLKDANGNDLQSYEILSHVHKLDDPCDEA